MIKTPDLTDDNFTKFKDLIYNKCGICLHEGKKELVRARLNKRLRQTGIKTFSDYYKYLTQEDNGNELVVMLDAISTNKTSFFREIKHFDFLKEHVFPKYAAGEYGNRLRFWSAACSSGEEPYTLAVSLLEYLGNKSFDIKILATDISTKVLGEAQRGVYPEDRIEDIPGPLIRNYFQQGHGRQKGFYRVKPNLRNIISFKRFNLMDKFPFNTVFQFIFCRNVMIYFDKKTQERLVNKFYHCIIPGGYLMIGHSESLTGVNHPFKYIQPSVYQKDE
jgi:chemotaxis protein methyltransferase CheR